MKKKSAKKPARKASAARRPVRIADLTGTQLLSHIEFNFVPYFVALTVVLLGLQLIVRRDRVSEARSPASMSEVERERPYREPMLREPSHEAEQPGYDNWRASRK